MVDGDAGVPRVGVLALQGDFAEHAGALRACGADPLEVRLPEHLDGVDALIIPGGESTTITRLLAIYGLREPIRARARAGMAIWGTCAGAIVLARRATDLDRPGLELMDIAVRRNAFGRQVDSFEADLHVKGIEGPPFHGVFIRAPIIESVGAGVDAIAKLDDGTIVAAREGRLLATVFHPELTPDRRFHQLFLALAAEAHRASASAS